MQPITITKSEYGYSIQQNGLSAEDISFEEVLGQVAAILLDDDPEPIKIHALRMKTPQQNADFRNKLKAIADGYKEHTNNGNDLY